MKINIIIIGLIIVLFRTNMRAMSIMIDSKNELLIKQSTIVSGDDNILKYSVFNAFDNNINTTIALNKNRYLVNGMPYFRMIFVSNYAVDKIIFRNGYQKSVTLFSNNSRVRELIIGFVEEYTNSYGKRKINQYETNILLNDSQERQEVIFNNSVRFYHVGFGVFSEYKGLRWDDICLSEIELWYKGNRYTFENLNETKLDYINMLQTISINKISNRHFLFNDKSYVFFGDDGKIYKVPDWRFGAHILAYHTIKRGGDATEIPGSFYTWKMANNNLYFKKRTNNDNKNISWVKVDLSKTKVIGYWMIKNGILYTANESGKMLSSDFCPAFDWWGVDLKKGGFKGKLSVVQESADPYIDGL